MAELKKSELLEVKNLSVSFFSPQGEICAVRDVSFSLKRGEVLAIVGESGCGKSALCKSIMKLLPEHAKIKSGSILINGADITNYGEREMQRLRGSLFSMVFQNPLTALAANTEQDFYYLDFGAAAADNGWKRILSEKQGMTSLNVAVVTAMKAFYTIQAIPGDMYDAMIIFGEVSPTTLVL